MAIDKDSQKQETYQEFNFPIFLWGKKSKIRYI